MPGPDALNPTRPDMPTAMRLRLDRRIHRQRVALRENWMIAEQRRRIGRIHQDDPYFRLALRLSNENRELRIEADRPVDLSAALAAADDRTLAAVMTRAKAILDGRASKTPLPEASPVTDRDDGEGAQANA